MSENIAFDPEHPELGWQPAVPEPYWVLRWTWRWPFRVWRPACYEHGTIVDFGRSKIPLVFMDKADWIDHWIWKHKGRDPDGSS